MWREVRWLDHTGSTNSDAAEAAEEIARLRADGETVVVDYGMEANSTRDGSRRLLKQDGKWVVLGD